jgi:hypothetical protein
MGGGSRRAGIRGEQKWHVYRRWRGRATLGTSSRRPTASAVSRARQPSKSRWSQACDDAGRGEQGRAEAPARGDLPRGWRG